MFGNGKTMVNKTDLETGCPHRAWNLMSGPDIKKKNKKSCSEGKKWYVMKKTSFGDFLQTEWSHLGCCLGKVTFKLRPKNENELGILESSTLRG